MIRHFKAVFLMMAVGSFAIDPEVTIPSMGRLRGKEIFTIGNSSLPRKPYFSFRNIPYAESVKNEKRFSQPEMFKGPLYEEDGFYDATKTGPLCQQMSLSSESIGNLTERNVDDLVSNLLGEGTGDILLPLFELMFSMKFRNRTVGELLDEWLDVNLSVDEDCLHLAVSTPRIPPNPDEMKGLLPVMFFVHGGAFYAGTQIKMGPERLGHVADIVLVAINYRVGPIGFMCLDTDESAGNMGMLDMVVALQWVQKYIHYFGGDPNQVTIFGESAGSASIGHLLLSNLTTGLFHRAIGQSGSAVSPWAFDFEPEFHARRIATKVGCDRPLQSDIVKCMKEKSAVEITKAHSAYVKEERGSGSLGFGGTIPCSQTKGDITFYYKGQHPEALLINGEYEKLPIFFGANSYEGSFVYGSVYNDFIRPNLDTLITQDFLKHEFVEFLLGVVGVTQGYAFSDCIQDQYFLESQLGNLDKMVYGAMDLLGVFFIKASGYKMVQENSKHAPSYWYSIEHKTRKSAYHLLFSTNKPPIPDPGVSHADELMYLFNLDLPFILCDFGEIISEILKVFAQECLFNLACLSDPNGPFRPGGKFMESNKDCILGNLTPEEQIWSDRIVTAWTNFAIYGTPTPNETLAENGFPYLPEWSRDNPAYLRFAKEGLTIESDYKKTYNVALDDFLGNITKPNVTTTSSTISTTISTTMPTTTTSSSTPIIKANVYQGLIILISTLLVKL